MLERAVDETTRAKREKAFKFLRLSNQLETRFLNGDKMSCTEIDRIDLYRQKANEILINL